MELTSTQFEILLNSNIENISAVCSINKSNRNICLSNYFWEEKFRHDDIPLMKMHDSIPNWILEYKWCTYCIKEAEKYLNYLELYKLSGSTPKEKSIYIDIFKINDINIFITEEMDRDIIERNFLKLLLRNANDRDTTGQVSFRFIDKKYTIEFQFEDDLYIAEISRDTCKYLIFVTWYYHLDPYDVYGALLF